MCVMPYAGRPDDTGEIAIFLRVLREVFQGQRWEDIEPSAHRAWNQIEQITGMGWDEVHETVQRAWRLH